MKAMQTLLVTKRPSTAIKKSDILILAINFVMMLMSGAGFVIFRQQDSFVYNCAEAWAR